MRFDSLPPETIVNILGLAGPIDIRRCQLVCRRLQELITTSSYLQYILELDECGYIVPLVSRPDFSYDEMMKMLREHREGWQDPSSRETEFIEISPRERVNSHVADGVFTYGHVYNTSEDILQRISTIDDIHFHRLRSINKGTDYKHWHHRDFGFPVEAFAIQPEIDLLVLVEGLILKQEVVASPSFGPIRKAYTSYRLHFHTMSTNTPHFLPRSTFLDTGLGGMSSFEEPFNAQPAISLRGRIIMLVGSTNHSATERTIVVWDWVEGVEILRTIVPMYPVREHLNTPCCHAHLLSEEYLAVFRVEGEPSPPTTPQVTKLGHFDIYQLRSEPNETHLVARFELPGLSVADTEQEITIGFGPAGLPQTPYWISKRQYIPRVYDTAQDGMFCLFLTLWVEDPPNAGRRTPYYFCLYVLVQNLLNHLETQRNNCPSVFSWSDWENEVRWVHSCSYGNPPAVGFNISRMRHSAQSFTHYKYFGDITQSVCDFQAILDFDPQRFKFTRAIERNTSNDDNRPPGLANDKALRTKFTTRLNLSDCGTPLFETPVNFAPSYRHMILKTASLRPGGAVPDSFLTEDEHIIVLIQGKRDENNPQLLEAMMRNVPKLKELNYTQWKNIITNSIKKAKLWGYVDGSIEEPSEHDAANLTIYYDEATAVRNAILGSLESGAQKYIEEALDAKEAWLTLEKKYLTAEADIDSKLVSIEEQLASLRLEEGGDAIEHIAEFCRMRCQLNNTRLAIDDQACISMLYRSLPSSYRQRVLTPEGMEMKDFSALCARLTYLSQNPEPETPVNEAPTSTEDYTTWGVPEDIKAFGLTGDKNPLLEERAAVTCRDCLLKDHQAGTPECPQYNWRKELWGTELNDTLSAVNSGGGPSAERTMLLDLNSKRLTYEFSEPVKVILDFDELELKPDLRQKLRQYSQPSAIQQCAILPIIQGRNILAQAPSSNGKTTALAVSILQAIDTTLSFIQALVFTSSDEATAAFQKVLDDLGSGSARCYSCNSADPLGRLASISGIQNDHIFVGTPLNLTKLLCRNIVNLRKLRIIALDDIDKLIEAGTESQILEVYRHVPPLAQVVASSTVCSAPVARAVARLLADPLQLCVTRNEGTWMGIHFYVAVPESQKLDAMYASFTNLGGDGVVVSCRHPPDPEASVMQNFSSHLSAIRGRRSRAQSYNYYNQNYDYYDYDHDVSYVVLVNISATFSIAEFLSLDVPLVNCDIPNNTEDYVKGIGQWRVTDPGQSQMIITLAAADTAEMHVIRELQSYGVQIAEGFIKRMY
ncbi:unnamed protein product [Rhizoctonia solani]|uniref:F-box domain-containing protein n=1 Tax=Rhizoctonia solani TaxID=456999 RepID=A0A8H3E1B9_9AGAM|nr:unnamed protein product [Rhizoctonia solani]